MNHRTPVPARRNEAVGLYDLAPGEFQMSAGNTGLIYGCPCGCASPGVLPFPGSGYATTWAWDGEFDRPTVTPSIRRLDGCKWHGHLIHGVWTPCGDSGQ